MPPYSFFVIAYIGVVIVLRSKLQIESLLTLLILFICGAILKFAITSGSLLIKLDQRVIISSGLMLVSNIIYYFSISSFQTLDKR